MPFFLGKCEHYRDSTSQTAKTACFTTRANGGHARNTCQMRCSTPTLPPWPTDGVLCGSNLSAMAVKRGAEVSKPTCFTARANRDPPTNTCQMRGSTPTWPPWPVDGALWGRNLSAMAAKCGPAVSNLSAMAAEGALSGRFGEPGGGPGARIHQKDAKSVTNRTVLLHESWPGQGLPGLA